MLAGGFVHRVRERADHAEDGAFDRLRQRRTCTVRALAHGGRKRGGVQLGRGAGVFGQAHQELRHDRAGVATCTVDGVIADPLQ